MEQHLVDPNDVINPADHSGPEGFLFQQLDVAVVAIMVILECVHDHLYHAGRRHTYFIVDHEKKFPDWGNRSKLATRVRQRGTSVTAEWGRVKWIGSKAKGTIRYVLNHIPRRKDSFAYSLDSLFKHAHDWEKGMVEITEGEFARSRRRLKSVQRVLGALRILRAELKATAKQL